VEIGEFEQRDRASDAQTSDRRRGQTPVWGTLSDQCQAGRAVDGLTNHLLSGLQLIGMFCAAVARAASKGRSRKGNCTFSTRSWGLNGDFLLWKVKGKLLTQCLDFQREQAVLHLTLNADHQTLQMILLFIIAITKRRGRP
jgi:hypothetical protein